MTLLNHAKDIVHNLKQFDKILHIVPCYITTLRNKRALRESMDLLVLQIPTPFYLLRINVCNKRIREMVMLRIVVSINVPNIVLRSVVHTVKQRLAIIILVRNDLVAVGVGEKTGLHLVLLIHIDKEANVAIALLDRYGFSANSVLVAILPMPFEVGKVFLQLLTWVAVVKYMNTLVSTKRKHDFLQNPLLERDADTLELNLLVAAIVEFHAYTREVVVKNDIMAIRVKLLGKPLLADNGLAYMWKNGLSAIVRSCVRAVGRIINGHYGRSSQKRLLQKQLLRVVQKVVNYILSLPTHCYDLLLVRYQYLHCSPTDL